jgi:uncharacterized protein (DUF433 family)
MLERNNRMNMAELVEVDPGKMGGTPCFTGTRVPIKNLFDYLETGDSLETFLDDFPTVSRRQAQGVLEVSRELLLNKYEIAA